MANTASSSNVVGVHYRVGKKIGYGHTLTDVRGEHS